MSEAKPLPKKPQMPIGLIVMIFIICFFVIPVWIAAPEAAPIVAGVFVPFGVIAYIAIHYSQKEEQYNEAKKEIEIKKAQPVITICEYCGTKFERMPNIQLCPQCGANLPDLPQIK
jgi:hypothetical protein